MFVLYLKLFSFSMFIFKFVVMSSCFVACRCCPPTAEICVAYPPTTPYVKVCCPSGCVPGTDFKICCPKELQVLDSNGQLIRCCPKELMYGPANDPQCCLPPNNMCKDPLTGGVICCPKPCGQDGGCCPPPTTNCPNNPLLPVENCCEEGWGCVNNT